LTNDLKISDVVYNGKIFDNPLCRPLDTNCSFLMETDNDNVIIQTSHIMNKDGKLTPIIITCGTTNQGMCWYHNYANLSDKQLIGEPNDESDYIISRTKTIVRRTFD